MKKLVLFIICLFPALTLLAQKATLRGNTIYDGNTAYAQLKKWANHHSYYSISSLDGKELLTLHPSRCNIKGKAGYCITFLNDQKKAILASNGRFPETLINEMVKYHLIQNATAVNEVFEQEYILSHPMPKGYIDVDDLNDIMFEDVRGLNDIIEY